MMKLQAYAKLNLSLRVVGRRTDGSHDIDSIIQTIDLADAIIVKRANRGVAVINDLKLPPDVDLAARAARLLLGKKRSPQGVQIIVEKRIPVGAGLGGGSSDAAAVLWAVDRLIPPPLPTDCLVRLAARLGADVPLFLTGGLVRVTGKGERIAPLHPLRKERFLLLVPPVHCATAAVYAHLDRIESTHCNSTTAPPLGCNDLEAAALDLYPALGPYREAIASLDAEYFGMSGSGSTFYAAFSDLKTATLAQEHLVASFPEAKTHLCAATDSGYHVEGEN